MNDAVPADHISGWHRQRPRWVAVETRQIILEDVRIQIDEIVGQLEAKAERLADVVARVRQDWEGQIVLSR